MQINALPFVKPDGDPVGCFSAILSFGGWENPEYHPVNANDMVKNPAEVLEFTKFIGSLFKELPTQDAFAKYVRKNGTHIDAVTQKLLYEAPLLDYVVTVSGYHVTIEPYRKEKS